MESDEKAILEYIDSAKDRIDAINELTGIFFLAIADEKGLELHVDASSQQYVCYGIIINNHLYTITENCWIYCFAFRWKSAFRMNSIWI